MSLGKIVFYQDCFDENFRPIENHFDIPTLEELENLFNQLKRQHQDGKEIIDFCMFLPSEITMSIILYGNQAVLNYYNPEIKESNSRCWKSVGDENEEEVLQFYQVVSQEWAKIPKRSLVSIEQAKCALIYFVQTNGQLTDEIVWENSILSELSQ
jgi:hypothetical protein